MIFKEILAKLTEFGQDIRILYVEDEDLIRENINVLLSAIFPYVKMACNGVEGIKLYEEEPFDLVISDILMPEMNGINMIEAMKKINPGQIVIVTSACEESNYLVELINLGVSRFVLKPMNTQQMIQTLYDVSESIINAKKVHEYTMNMKHELAYQSTLLEQYKEVVDISMIVSKTDLDGRITYVNEAFCTVSGYTEEELLGENHNIVRHNDEPSELFETLWKTIKSKNVWTGRIKNKKKDDGYYIANTTIKPILDETGELVEYISARYDVTELYDLYNEISKTQHEMLHVLGEIGETRSKETGGHVRRVAQYSKLLAELYGLNKDESHLLYSASPMHDIGKIAIPDAILLKPSSLDDEEFSIIKSHSSIGYELLKNSKRPLMQAASIIAHEHHEKWDGSGYPRALEGENIHIYGRITALADVFDALRNACIYRKAWTEDEIIDLIRTERGKHFDPQLVDLFMENLDQFLKIAEEA